MRIKKKTLLWGVIGILFAITLFLTFKAGGTGVSVETAKSAGIAAKSAASSGMVGGC